MGNIFVLESFGYRIRRINNHGIISTIAGNGTYGFSGDGLPAVFAKMQAVGLWAGTNGLFIADRGNCRVRNVLVGANTYSNHFITNLNPICKGAQFSFITSTYTSASIKTWYGDGTSDSALVLPVGTTGYASTTHQYPASGTFTVKHVFRVAGASVDSMQYPYFYNFCNTLPIYFYYDISGTCSYNSSSPYCTVPITAQITKNGIPIDTVSATSGIYYSAYGGAGDIFSYKILSSPAALNRICPATAIISDTLQIGIDTASTKYFGLGCTGGSSCNFDLAVNAVVPVTGPNDQWGNIYISNTSIFSVPPVVTLHFSPKYRYLSGALPIPSSTTSNSISWNLSGIDYTSAPINLYYAIWDNPSTGLLTIRDTVHEYITADPTSGDADPSNNAMVIIDTVRAGCDPNEMYVVPQGYIQAGTQLKYTINFMNTGNDTAHNIYVMDTLSDFVNPSSLRIVNATNVMNVTKMYDNICHNIVRFDFPNINLLDSSHHNACTGGVSFTINTLSGLPNGTAIFNQAGIFFDVNAVVMTNTIENIIGDTSTRIINVHSQPADDKVLVYPNPATTELTIKTTPTTYTSLTITNTIGQVMVQQPLNAGFTKVDVKKLPAGVYYISLKGMDGNVVRKFVRM